MATGQQTLERIPCLKNEQDWQGSIPPERPLLCLYGCYTGVINLTQSRFYPSFSSTLSINSCCEHTDYAKFSLMDLCQSNHPANDVLASSKVKDHSWVHLLRTQNPNKWPSKSKCLLSSCQSLLHHRVRAPRWGEAKATDPHWLWRGDKKKALLLKRRGTR